MFSEALRIMDRNTVQYMIEEQQAQIQQQQGQIQQQQALLDAKDTEIARLKKLLQENS